MDRVAEESYLVDAGTVVYEHVTDRVAEESYLIDAGRVVDKHVTDRVTEEPHDYDGSSCCRTAAHDSLIGDGVNQRQLRRTLVSCTTQYTVSPSHHKHNTMLMHHTIHHHITNTTQCLCNTIVAR